MRNYLNKKPSNIQNLYEILRDRILELDDIDLEVKKVYIEFKGVTNIVDVELFKKEIQITFNIKYGKLEDPGYILKISTLEIAECSEQSKLQIGQTG